MPLTDAGRAAAALVHDRFAGRGWALALASPLSRAADTAELAGIAVAPEPDLLEWDYGDYEGVTTVQVRETRPDWSLWTDGCPGGEGPDDVSVRVDRVIARAAEAAAGGDVVLVAHGHVLRVLTARWLEQPAAFGARIVLPTLGVGVLGWEREVRALLGWGAG